jgi:signal transduction histidine kinase
MIDIILRNLLSNAIKYSYENGVVSVTTLLKENHAEVNIIDKGIGISEENKRHLFKSSFSNTTSGTLKEKGTGLGLMLCKELIEKNKGEIWVQSSVGIGSTFTISLPTTTNKY